MTYMGFDTDDELYPAFGKWYFYDENGESIGPFNNYFLALTAWKAYARYQRGKFSLGDWLYAWWHNGKQQWEGRT